MKTLDPVSNAVMKDGSAYLGGQRFRGTGITKWCALCGKHVIPGGGHVRFVMGARSWVCLKHPRLVK